MDSRFFNNLEVSESRYMQCVVTPHFSTEKNLFRSSRPDVFLGKGVLKTCNKITGEHPCHSVISIKMLCNFIKIALRHNLQHIFGTPFPKNSPGWLLLSIKKDTEKRSYWQKLLIEKSRYCHNQLRKTFWQIRWPQIMQYSNEKLKISSKDLKLIKDENLHCIKLEVFHRVSLK